MVPNVLNVFVIFKIIPHKRCKFGCDGSVIKDNVLEVRCTLLVQYTVTHVMQCTTLEILDLKKKPF
jgi:hypothetical protein